MGLKFRLGLAVGGLLCSSMFGTNMLFGIKDYVDTTGNIMVDIADGIGMMSTGIEALEHWIDPSGHPLETDKTESKEGLTPAAPAPVESPPPTEAPKPLESPGPLPKDQPTVFCQKGKCYPYDPAKLKKANIELEATPGMIYTAPTPTKKPIQKQQQPQKGKKRNEKEEDDEDEKTRKKPAGAGRR